MSTLSEAIDGVASDVGFSGVVRVDDGDQLQHAKAYGLAHRGFGIPNKVDTQFAIASGGKGFTALAVVSLIADGLLSLDTTARSVLGDDLPEIADDVTVEQLLAHTSGIGDYLDEYDDSYGPEDYVLKQGVHELAETEPFIDEVDGYPTKFKAGEGFSYCNGGYIVLAVIAERVSRVPYHQLVHHRVIDPTGLSDTDFLRSDEPSGRMAVGYLHSDDLRSNVLHLPVRGNGDGGIYTTAADLRTLWLSFTEGRIIPEEWVSEMTHPRSEVPDENARYGLGFWLAPAGPVIKLLGGDTGVSFFSAHNPATRSTWTVLSNTTDGAWPVVKHIESSID